MMHFLRKPALLVSVSLLIAVFVQGDRANADIHTLRNSIEAKPLGGGTRLDANSCSPFPGQRVYSSYFYFKSNMSSIVAYRDNPPHTRKICEFGNISGEVGGLAANSDATLWVSEQNVPALALYQPGAVGPLSVISGANTLMLGSSTLPLKGIGVDPSTGYVWVPNDGEGAGYLTAFSRSENGNQPPVATIGYVGLGKAQGFGETVDVKFDANGNMFVGDAYRVMIFSPPFSDSSLPIAIWNIPQQDHAWYLTFDRHGNLYVMSQYAIYVFKGGLRANGKISRQIDLVPGGYGIGADTKHFLYVANSFGLDALATSARTYDPVQRVRFPKNVDLLTAAASV